MLDPVEAPRFIMVLFVCLLAGWLAGCLAGWLVGGSFVGD